MICAERIINDLGIVLGGQDTRHHRIKYMLRAKDAGNITQFFYLKGNRNFKKQPTSAIKLDRRIAVAIFSTMAVEILSSNLYF